MGSEDAHVRRIEELDGVELTEAAAGWPVGTPGVVVDVPAEGYVTVEVDNGLLDATRSLLDALVDVPACAVRVTARYSR